MRDILHQTLAGIVTGNHRTAPILEKYSLDFCCKGKRTLEEACKEKGLSTVHIARELEQTDDMNNPQMTFDDMTAEQLVNHILENHHAYVRRMMPPIYAHLEKIAITHGDSFPYMKAVYGLFAELVEEMNEHMMKEEKILFPGIIEAEKDFIMNGSAGDRARFIHGAIGILQSEHDRAGEIMHAIRGLTNNYSEPEGACTTFRLTIGELKAFEEDLQQHEHLENNILFPMARNFA